MSPRKKNDVVAGQSLEPVITTLLEQEPVVVPPPAPRKEKLLSFRANVSFSDGNLREFMEEYGYECEWRMNEVRRLPAWLIKRCIQSGAELDRADG